MHSSQHRELQRGPLNLTESSAIHRTECSLCCSGTMKLRQGPTVSEILTINTSPSFTATNMLALASPGPSVHIKLSPHILLENMIINIQNVKCVLTTKAPLMGKY